MGKHIYGRCHKQVISWLRLALGQVFCRANIVLYFFLSLNTFRLGLGGGGRGMLRITPYSSSPAVLFPVWLIPLCYLPVSCRHLSLGLPSMELLLLNKMVDKVLIKDYANNRPSQYRSSHLIREAYT